MPVWFFTARIAGPSFHRLPAITGFYQGDDMKESGR
jgi:hypothetical protein